MPYDDELRARFGHDIELAGEVPDDAWLRQVLMRRTQRRYADRAVPDSLVRLLLAAAFSASSKSDFQQASCLWLKDRVRRDRVAALFPDMPWIGAAPVFLVFLGDSRRLERLGALRGHPQDNGALEGFFNAAIDAGLALQSCILAAETLGLGTCPISVLRNRIAEVGEILALPNKVFPGFASGTRRRVASSACVCRSMQPCTSTATMIRAWTRRSTPMTVGATRAIRSPIASAPPSASAPRNSTAGRKTRRARR